MWRTCKKCDKLFWSLREQPSCGRCFIPAPIADPAFSEVFGSPDKRFGGLTDIEFLKTIRVRLD